MVRHCKMIGWGFACQDPATVFVASSCLVAFFVVLDVSSTLPVETFRQLQVARSPSRAHQPADMLYDEMALLTQILSTVLLMTLRISIFPQSGLARLFFVAVHGSALQMFGSLVQDTDIVFIPHTDPGTRLVCHRHPPIVHATNQATQGWYSMECLRK